MKEVELAEYIVQHFEEALTDQERSALLHHRTLSKIGEPGVDISEDKWHERQKHYLANGLLSSDPQVLSLLESGYDQFLVNLKRRVLKESPDMIYFRLCPQCEKPARSPHATQCAYCGYVWEA